MSVSFFSRRRVQYAVARQQAIAALRSSPSNLQLLPPIKPVPQEEKLYEANIARAYKQRVEQQERDIDVAVSGLEQLSKQRVRLEQQVHQAVLDVDEVEQGMKVHTQAHSDTAVSDSSY